MTISAPLNKMKKILAKKIIPTIFYLSLFLLAIFNVQAAKAANNLDDAFKVADSVASTSGYQATDLNTLLGNGIMAILSLIGVVFMVFIIYAGFTWMTAAGNEERTSRSKETLKQSVIGLIVVLCAYAITYFLINIFGSQISL